MNESTVRINGAVLTARLKKAFIFVRDNRNRITQERLNHYLYMVNSKNYQRSKKWWAFLVPKKFKTPISDSQISDKVKQKIICNWGDVDRLKNIEKLCITGHDITLCSSDMEALINAEKANSWKSGITIRNKKDISDIWC